MKRCFKGLFDWLTEWIGRFDWDQIVGFAIGIALTIVLFVYMDKDPATPSDYEQLENQVNVIQQNPDLLLEADCNININGEITTVELENDECKMTAKYNKDFEVLSISKEDKSIFWLLALAISLFFGVAIFSIFQLVIIFLKIVVILIFERVKKLKAEF